MSNAQKQIDAIKKVNNDARKTKETARKYLIEAGIIKDKDAPQKKGRKKR